MPLNPADLIYGGDTVPATEDVNNFAGPILPTRTHASGSSKSVSMYVTLFEDMIRTVLENESTLFTNPEIGYFKCYNKLSYHAKFLLVRLSLRKADKWFRFSDMSNYEKELGDNTAKAMEELCRNAKLKVEDERIRSQKAEEASREYIVIPDDDEAAPPPASTQAEVESEVKAELEELKVKAEGKDPKVFEMKAETSQAGSSTPTREPWETAILAEGEESAEIQELLGCLKVAELQILANSMKVKKQNLKREELIEALVTSASSQTTITFSGPRKGKAKDRKASKQTMLSFSKKGQTQSTRLRELVMVILGKCLRLNPSVMELFRRVQLVYYRYTKYEYNFMTPAILARCRKRNYANYDYKRTANIWSSRDALLEYERALIKELEIEEAFAGKSASTAHRGRSTASRTPTIHSDGVSSSAPPIRASDATSSRAAESPSRTRQNEKGVPEIENSRQVDAQIVVELFESVYDEWKALCLVKSDPETGQANGLERFDCGHVLTRIVCQGARALGVLKQDFYELQVLDDLLAQTKWRKAKRGRWHERRALILMKSKDKQTLLLAQAAVEAGLNDPHTHSIWRPKLRRRLVTLEKKLNIQNKHVMTGKRLEKAGEEYVSGERIHFVLNGMGRPVDRSSAMLPPPTLPLSQYFRQEITGPEHDKPEVKFEKAKGKSVWKGRDEEHVSVEILALQHYESQGYKGFHCEGKALRTIFGILFWDIIFAPIPGAFETPYQTAPLDISHESFYTSRQHLIDERLDDIRHGKAHEILEAIDIKHRERATWCVGVNWDAFERQDLLEIVDCLEDRRLAELCLIIAEDYTSRSSGLPDLVIWDVSRKENKCMFVEVKGPGDSLQENQKTWLDMLICAEVPVAVCHVYEVGNDPRQKPGKRKKAAKNSPKKEKDSEHDEPESEDEPPRKRQRRTGPLGPREVSPVV